MPAVHDAHTVCPGVVDTFPGRQLRHACVAGADVNVPGAHATHADCAASGAKPASHGQHTVAPVAFVKWPDGHLLHVTVATDAVIVPGAQAAQSVIDELRCLPGVHSAQCVPPGVGDTVPRPHCRHAVRPPLGVTKSTAHVRQCVDEAANVPAGHVSHCDRDALLKRPVAHARHAVFANAGASKPGAQSRHAMLEFCAWYVCDGHASHCDTLL